MSLRFFVSAFAGMVLLLTLPSCGRASDAGGTSPPTSTPDPHRVILALAKEWFHRFQTGNIDHSQLDQRINKELTQAMIRKEETTLKAYGTPISFVYVRSEPIDGAKGYYFLLDFKFGRIVEAVALHPDGKIAGIDFATFVPATGGPTI